MSFPELESDSYVCSREAWPPGLLRAGESGYESEALRCAPQNWVARRPVGHFGNGMDVVHARYPPRNMLNALYCNGPRAKGISRRSKETVLWMPTATYSEPPFPFQEGYSATEGLKNLAKDKQNVNQDVDVLQLLRSIYENMGDRESGVDQWLQKPATRASTDAFYRFNETLFLLRKRDNIRPRQLMTIFQAFRNDASVQAEVVNETNKVMKEEMRNRREILSSQFEAKMGQITPEHLSILRQDKERYEAELQSFARENSTNRSVERELREQDKRYAKAKADMTLTLFEQKKLEPGALEPFHRLVEQDKQRFAREQKEYKQEIVREFDEENSLLAIQGPLPRLS